MWFYTGSIGGHLATRYKHPPSSSQLSKHSRPPSPGFSSLLLYSFFPPQQKGKFTAYRNVHGCACYFHLEILLSPQLSHTSSCRLYRHPERGERDPPYIRPARGHRSAPSSVSSNIQDPVIWNHNGGRISRCREGGQRTVSGKLESGLQYSPILSSGLPWEEESVSMGRRKAGPCSAKPVVSC